MEVFYLKGKGLAYGLLIFVIFPRQGNITTKDYVLYLAWRVGNHKKGVDPITNNISVMINTLFYMYPIKFKFLTVGLLAGLVCQPLTFISQTKVLAVDQILKIAQKSSDYNQYMRLGYTETRRRNYKRALAYFQQALQVRPNDQYATAAIRNVTSYQRRSGLIGFVPVGKPGRTQGGATRGGEGCFLNKESAVPLIPTSEEKEAQVTTAEHPTFFLYIPQTDQQIQALEFVLQDDATSKPLYEQSFKPVGQPGIVSVTIPADQPSLKTGKKYTWEFSIICDSYGDKDVHLKGKIERLQDENLADQIQQTTKPLDQAIIYATAGFWENSLSIIANLRRDRPNDPEVQKYWADLLKSVNLDKVVEQPLLPSLVPLETEK